MTADGAMTVLGPVPAESLGIALMHEHLLADNSAYYLPPTAASKRALGEERVGLSNVGTLRRNLYALKDNLILADVSTAIEEIMEFVDSGGGTVVDVTPSAETGRDPEGLQAISRRTGLNIVMGCGHYIHLAHDPQIEEASVDSIAESLVRDITHGIGRQRVRPGIIGEIGTWDPVHPNEAKVLRAAARAQDQTGLAITVHLHVAGRAGHEVLDVLADEGADLSRVVLGHLDINLGHLDATYGEVIEYHKSLASRGCYLEYDSCGTEVYSPENPYVPAFWTPSDLTRARAIVELADSGCSQQLLISHDVFTKVQLSRFGGMGYGYIAREFQHHLREVGLKDDHLNQLLVDNPRRILTVPIGNSSTDR